MMLRFRNWLEDCGPVTKDYANTVDSNSNSKLSYVRSNRMEGQRKERKDPLTADPEELFGMNRKAKKMKK